MFLCACAFFGGVGGEGSLYNSLPVSLATTKSIINCICLMILVLFVLGSFLHHMCVDKGKCFASKQNTQLGVPILDDKLVAIISLRRRNRDYKHCSNGSRF